jgi:4-amino-4-deoxy-L-arabinose transferase-like glycosyltransferase
MSVLKAIKKNYLILILILLASLIRVWGINYGLPHFFIGDETSIAYGTFKMAELKTLIPALYPDQFRPMYYPPLLAYIYLIVLAPVLGVKYLIGDFVNFTDFRNYLILNPTTVWITIRLVSVIFGTATIYLVYLATKELFDKRAGLMAALFLAVSFLHLQQSHFARHWVPATFFAALIILFSVFIYKQPAKKYYIWLGVIAGLAFGLSYITCVSLVVFVLAHLMAGKNASWRISVIINKFKDKNFWLAILIFVTLAVVFVLLHPQEFTRILFGVDSGAREAKSLAGLSQAFLYHIKNLLNFEPLLFISAILGSIILWFKSKERLILLLSLPVIYILALYLFFHNEVRYIVFVLPVLAGLAGFALSFIFSQIRQPALSVILLLIIFSYPLALGFYSDFLLTQKDTRILAVEWINQNISSASKIVTRFEDIKLIANKKAILNQQQLAPNSLRIQERVLLELEDSKYPKPAFNVLSLHFISKSLPDDIYKYLQKNEYQYFVVEYWHPDYLMEQDKIIIEPSKLLKEFKVKVDDNFLQDITGNFYQPVFWLFKVKRLGPVIRIYQL